MRGDPASTPQLVIWEHEGNRAVRLDQWKAVSYYTAARGCTHTKVGRGRRTGPWELYDLSRDRCELNDLARDEPGRLRELVENDDDWADRTKVTHWQDIQAKWGQLDDGDP